MEDDGNPWGSFPASTSLTDTPKLPDFESSFNAHAGFEDSSPVQPEYAHSPIHQPSTLSSDHETNAETQSREKAPEASPADVPLANIADLDQVEQVREINYPQIIEAESNHDEFQTFSAAPDAVAAHPEPLGSEASVYITPSTHATTDNQHSGHVGASTVDDDDDFGDFGDFDAAPAAPAVPAPVQPLPVSEPLFSSSFGTCTSDPGSEERVLQSLNKILNASTNASKSSAIAFSAALANVIPLGNIPGADAPVEGLIVVKEEGTADTSDVKILLTPNSKFENEEWYQLWKAVAVDQTYSENILHNFRWKKSHVRNEFLNALNMSEDILLASESTNALKADGGAVSGAEGGAQQATDAGLNAESPVSSDPRQAELDKAKKYCTITEDEIRGMSIAELSDLVQALAQLQVKMQEQSNFWLDSKEQLLMDAEMHNKMIASLVLYATQKPKGSPKTGERVFGGKKK
ncbi:hypothetical protein HDU80_010236 [Chytriomyces hyalinus]|nr:hypothetical protein HDU80_010236 [Chytriomyces hyalinus]